MKQAIQRIGIGVTLACVWWALAPWAVWAAVHIVQPGETLISIAQRYGTTVEQLISLNELADANKIRAGERLNISGQPDTYIVQPGDTLSRIAKMFGLKVGELAQLNGIVDVDRIRPGQELIVAARIIEHQVVRGDTVIGVAKKYGVTTQSLIAMNDLKDPDRLRIGQTLLIPPMGGSVVETLAAPRPGGSVRTFARWPVQGIISSQFGVRGGRPHEGIDIAAPNGTVVRAVAAGKVVYADWAGTYGLLIKIDHGGGVETRYAHNSRITVSPGATVEAGQVIARVGSTGRSTGPHLHFEVRINGEAVDPIGWLP